MIGLCNMSCEDKANSNSEVRISVPMEYSLHLAEDYFSPGSSYFPWCQIGRNCYFDPMGGATLITITVSE